MNIGTFLLVKNTLSDIKLCHMKGGVFAPIKRCSWWIIDQAPMTAKTSAGVSTLFSHLKKKIYHSFTFNSLSHQRTSRVYFVN